MESNERTEISTEKHAYVSQEVPTWRTCAMCGCGANAKIHRDLPIK
jgi:hypothetical protein